MNDVEKKYLTKIMKTVPANGIVVEVGSYVGVSSQCIGNGIAKYCPSAKFYCIDTFKGSTFMDGCNGRARNEMVEMYAKNDVKAIFEKNMEKYPHQTLVMTSLDACKKFDDLSIDFIFIDADHSYDAVKADINAWLPKIKLGGLMTGHDYSETKTDVKKAVDEMFGNKAKLDARSIWRIVKN